MGCAIAMMASTSGLSLWERPTREARRVRVEAAANIETLTLPSSMSNRWNVGIRHHP